MSGGSLETPTPPVKERFWKRQYSTTITRPQIIFDLIFGAVIPIILLIVDPAIFRSTAACFGPLLADYALFVYLAVGLGVLTLVIWLLAPGLRSRAAPF